MNKGPSNQHEYTERYRPQFHFSTPQGNLADPNGLVYYNETYHLFHQKDGNWAHAISEDLLHWKHLPLALEHDELGQALSGSVVVDHSNHSGLFDRGEGLVAFYTSTEGGEAQSLAYNCDDGFTWQRYPHNPVIQNPGIKDFRDPKVLWHDDSNAWVMVVSTDQTVSFYRSHNLVDWTYSSEFGEHEGLHVAVWECPDLFPLPVDGSRANEKWVLHVSVGDNDETKGSTAQYFIGEFDGYAFHNDNPADEVLITDYGQDFYAAQTFYNVNHRTIWLGWMANWRYPYQSPTNPWMGSMSFPRELSLVTNREGQLRLAQQPIAEIEQLNSKERQFETFEVQDESFRLHFQGTNYLLEATVTWEELREFGLRLRHGDGVEALVWMWSITKCFLTRTNAGLKTIVDRCGEEFPFGQRYEAEYDGDRNTIDLKVLVDESSIELFVQQGVTVFTSLIYTEPTNDGIEWYAADGSITVKDFTITHLHNTWREQTDTVDRLVTNVEEQSLLVGEQHQVKAALKPDEQDFDEDKLIWRSADERVVKVIQMNGRTCTIEAVKEGHTTLHVCDQRSGSSSEIQLVVEDERSFSDRLKDVFKK
ncbi:LOW QUALITY PROTEIN: sucrose-6-phosphate hydrolase [Geomicrobium sp. JCM 19037]|nr:LOW QUALITY PROTEIN: sucrose-6-phosphate hydrolase [Geomicrobium sp. JCM 19037]